MVKAPKSSVITPIRRSLHWLKINERIEYKLLSLTYKVLTTSQPDYLHNLISVQSSGRTRSSSLVTLARPSVSSSLQNTNRSFTYASPYLWNHLPSSFRQPHCVHSPPGSPHRLLHSLSGSVWTSFTDVEPVALAFVCFRSFFVYGIFCFWFRVLGYLGILGFSVVDVSSSIVSYHMFYVKLVSVWMSDEAVTWVFLPLSVDRILPAYEANVRSRFLYICYKTKVLYVPICNCH